MPAQKQNWSILILLQIENGLYDKCTIGNDGFELVQIQVKCVCLSVGRGVNH